MKKIKAGDTVIVTKGKSKGIHGKVLRTLSLEDKVVVEGANVVTKNVKADPRNNVPGGKKTIEAPIHVSNVAIYNPASKKADKIVVKILDNGKRARYYKSSDELVEI